MAGANPGIRHKPGVRPIGGYAFGPDIRSLNASRPIRALRDGLDLFGGGLDGQRHGPYGIARLFLAPERRGRERDCAENRSCAEPEICVPSDRDLCQRCAVAEKRR